MGFVVLHGDGQVEATCRTVESIQALFRDAGNDACRLVVVDDASEDGGQLLSAFCEAGWDGKVALLRNHARQGLAQSFNLGYLYLRANFPCDFLVLLRAGVTLPSGQWPDDVRELYAETHFAVLGAALAHGDDAETLRGYSPQGLQKLRAQTQGRLRHYGWFRFRQWLGTPFRKAGRVFRRRVELSSRMEGVVLDTACLVLSPLFMRQRPLCLNPGTFRGMEADILHRECLQGGLKMVYDAQLPLLCPPPSPPAKGAAEREALRDTLQALEVLAGLMDGERAGQ